MKQYFARRSVHLGARRFMACFRGYFFLCVCFTLFVISGCSHSMPNTYVRKDYDASSLRKVAVFPFHNRTNTCEASKVVTSAFVAGLVEKGRSQVESQGNITGFLVSERIIVRTGLDLDSIKCMGKRLGVDAVILGEVEEFVGMDEKNRGVVPVVSINSRMVDGRTGRILWMAQHRKTGDDYVKILNFGKVRSVGELTKKVVGEMIRTMQ